MNSQCLMHHLEAVARYVHRRAVARVEDWVEESLLVTALPWAQERRVGAVLQAFSPTLTHRSDGNSPGSNNKNLGWKIHWDEFKSWLCQLYQPMCDPAPSLFCYTEQEFNTIQDIVPVIMPFLKSEVKRGWWSCYWNCSLWSRKKEIDFKLQLVDHMLTIQIL